MAASCLVVWVEEWSVVVSVRSVGFQLTAIAFGGTEQALNRSDVTDTVALCTGTGSRMTHQKCSGAAAAAAAVAGIQ